MFFLVTCLPPSIPLTFGLPPIADRLRFLCA
jgi:hypothetical protein